MARQPLGRGLSALLGDTPGAAAKTEIAVNEVDIDLIDPNPEQPRTRFVESAMDELAASIRSNGIVQPIVVAVRGDKLEIVKGKSYIHVLGADDFDVSEGQKAISRSGSACRSAKRMSTW